MACANDGDLRGFVARFIDACPPFATIGYDTQLNPFIEEAKGLSSDARARLAVLFFEAAAKIVDQVTQTGEPRMRRLMNFHECAPYAYAVTGMAARLLMSKLPLTPDDLAEMLNHAVKLEVISTSFMLHIPPIIQLIESQWDELQGDQRIRTHLAALDKNATKVGDVTVAEIASRLRRMLGATPALPIEPGTAWSDAAISDFNEMKTDQQEKWGKLLVHCLAAKPSKASSKWSKTAQQLADSIGRQHLEHYLLRWFPLVGRPHPVATNAERWRAGPFGTHLPLSHEDILKGLCWIAAICPTEQLPRALGSLAIACYQKIPRYGPRAAKVGNAAVNALAQIAGRDSLGQLAVLRIKIKFIPAQKLIEKALDAAAEREGLPRDELDEMAVPSYGLSEVGRLEESLGECTAVLRIGGAADPNSASLEWINEKGKQVKSIPAAVKRDHADEIKELKGAVQDIQRMLPAQRDRLDSLFLDRKTWAFATWRERYLDHPLVGTIARRLIWLFHGGRDAIAAAWLADDPTGPPHGPGQLVDADGTPYLPDEANTTVSLWHPIDPNSLPGSTETRSDIAAWRAFYEQREIRQPFKQAHREVYLLTDAERNTEVYSNRFAAHIVRQHQFNALCSQRNWRNQLRLMVDADYEPAKKQLPAWNLRAEFWVEGVGDDYSGDNVLESGAFRYLATDQVRFYSIAAALNSAWARHRGYEMLGPDSPENRPIPLDRIPPIVLSEILRDADLFVGVASVGNNPEWADGGPDGRFREYWHNYAFGELSATAQTRREFLKRLVPRLSIAAACTVTEKFLVVLGKRRTYKIHFGSGNIQMEPGNQYLCIVPTGRTETGPEADKLFLPFEGDRTLAIILSKAFLLADDDKITDRSILNQIGR